MKELFITPNGEKLLKDWGNEYAAHERAARRAVRAIYPRFIKIENGADFLDGFAYTSTSDFAAIWQVNTEARWLGEFRADGLRAYFDGVAINEHGKPVFILTLIDEDGNECGTEYWNVKKGATV